VPQILLSTYLQKLHEKLIERYLSKSDCSFQKLPDDGYIHFYLGYHLYKSGKYNYFSEAYLNILFIGEKIRITGSADLLVDIRKYQDFIVGDVRDFKIAHNCHTSHATELM
jgi:hypothetical protein